MTRSVSGTAEVRTGQPVRASALSGAGLDFRVWDVYHLCFLVVAAAQVWTDGTPSVVSRSVATVALAGLATAYVLRGRALATVHDEATGPGLRYLAVVSVAYGVAVVASAPASWALASLCVQALLVVRWRLAVPCIAVLALVQPVANLVVRHSTEGLAGLLALAAATTVGSAVMSGWIDQLAAQSEERARLVAELEASRGEVARLSHETGVLAERARLRAEIHDTLAQGYTSILALVQAAEQSADRARASSLLELAATTCRENLAEARAIVAADPPPALGVTPALGGSAAAGGSEAAGGSAVSGVSPALGGSVAAGVTTPSPADGGDPTALVDALGRLVARLEAETGIGARFVVEHLPGDDGHDGDGGDGVGGPRPLDRALEVTVLRVTQEALTNVRKHAGARQVLVELTIDPMWVTLVVHDDGVGLGGASTEPAADDVVATAGSTGGFGVGGMRARVEELGGTLDLADAVGGGTELRVEVPR